MPNVVVSVAFALYPADPKLLLGKTRSKAKSVDQDRKMICLAYLCLMFVARAGDIELNPGPDFPCKICSLECDWTTYAVQCDECSFWFHAECMHMNISQEYAALEDSDVVWICSECGEPNYSSSLLSSFLTSTANSFSVLTSVSSEDDIKSPIAASSPKYNKLTNSSSSNLLEGGRRVKWSQKPKSSTSRVVKINKISVMTINFQSVKNKAAELAICLNTYKPDILIGTESWLSEDVSNSEIFPPEYCAIRKDRPPNLRGQSHGGIFIAMRGDLVMSHCCDLDEECEILWAQLELVGAKKIVVGAFYRPPESGPPVLDSLKSSLSKIDMNKVTNVWLSGDFNLRGINWENQCLLPDCDKPGLCKQLIDIANDYNLEQLIREPTRGRSILDLFFTSNPTVVVKSEVLPGMSDHDGIPFVTINIKPKINKSKPRKVFMYRKANWSAIKEDLADISGDFEDVCLDMVSVDELWNDFKTRINDTVERNIPSKFVTPNKQVPWCDKKVSKLLYKKKKAFNKAKASDNSEDWDTFRSMRKSVNRTIRSNFRKYVRNTCESSTKKFFSLVKNLKRDSSGISTLKSSNGMVSDNIQKAQALNHQFESVFTQETTDNIPNLPHSIYPDMPDMNISVTGVEKLLTDLNPNKATGPDGVSSHILKMGAKEIAPALATIFSKSLKTGLLPEDWRCANISPIFKKGDRIKPSNYRPVSLTSVSCKVMEHVVHSNIMQHLDRYDILTDQQHGFRRNRSCESQLILTTNDLASALDKRQQTDVIIMDFSKAFDVVPHQRLLLKLNHYGIRGPTLTWITNFLTRRMQRVVIGGDYSDWVHVKSGVPQGTVLGPLLFLLYINDLPDQITSTVRLFADDCVMYRTISNDHDADLLQADLDRLSSWQHQWQMKFNADKCFVLKITNSLHPKTHSYTLNSHILQETKSHQYLGVDISHNMKWNNHVNNICAKGNRNLGFVKRNLKACTQDIKNLAYCTLVRPSLEYCGAIWDPHTADLTSKLEAIQRRAARFVVNDYNWQSSVTRMMQELNWKSLTTRRKINRISVFQKACQGHLAIPTESLLHPVTRPTRRTHSKSFINISSKSDSYKYSFIPRTVADWNQLPEPIIQIQDSKAFKAALNNHFDQ